MRKLFLFLCAVMFASQAWAAKIPTTWKIDGIVYTRSVSTNIVSAKHDVEKTLTGAIEIQSKVQSNVVNFSVKAISPNGFSGCSEITSVTIPTTISTIGSEAFSGCTGIESLYIPSSVTSIGSNAFLGVQKVVYAGTVNQGTYGAEVAVAEFELEADGKTLKKYNGPGGDVTIPDCVTAINADAFSGSSNIQKLIVPSTVTTIGTDAFLGIPKVVYSGSADGRPWGAVILEGASDFVLSSDGKTLLKYFGAGGVVDNIPNTITAIGDNAFKNCNTITMVEIPGTVMSIGTSAFQNCTGMESVIIPEGVSHIGNNAFNNCYSLTSLNIPDSVRIIEEMTFYGCSGLTDIVIPDSVASIYNNAFANCTALESVTMPNSYTVGNGAFLNCDNVEYITQNGVKYLVTKNDVANNDYEVEVMSNDPPYSGTLSIADVITLDDVKKYKVTSIWMFAFSDCKNLTTVNIPNSVNRIGNTGGDTFAGCGNLEAINVDSDNPNYTSEDGVLFDKNKTVIICYPADKDGTTYKIPETVTKIGFQSFLSCDKLESVTIPENVREINREAFSGCTNLKSVNIPEGVTDIGLFAFLGCESLASLFIPSSVENIGDDAFSDVQRVVYAGTKAGETYGAIEAVAEFELSSDEKTLEKYNGQGGDVVIPDGVAAIDNEVFRNRDDISSVTFPNSLETIGNRAFGGCIGLKSIEIPQSVESIASNAFEGCDNLTDVYFTKDGIRYRKLNDNEVEVTSYWTWDTGNSYNGSVVIPESVLLGEKTYLVTRIGESAFYYSSLTAIDIPSSVTSIGDWAFDRCPLESIVIPESVESIGEGALQMCFNLTSVAIPESVKTIGDNAFAGSNSITSVSIENDADFSNAELYFTQDGIRYHVLNKNKVEVVAVNDPNSYSGNVVIPQKVGTFTVTAIGDEAFKGCESLTSITIPESVESIGESAFEGCQSLTSIVIPESVKTVGDNAFRNCTNLAEVVYNPATTTIGENAFVDTKVIIQKPVPEEGFVYEVLPASNAATITSYNGTVPATLTIPKTTTINGNLYEVTSIAEGAFANCSTLESVNISNSVTSIGDKAFANCTNLQTVFIGNSVKSIGAEAFSNCRSMSDITISGPITFIGKNAFSCCFQIKTIKVPGQASDIRENAFQYVKNVEYSGQASGKPWGALTVNGHIEGDFVYSDTSKIILTAYIGNGGDVEIDPKVQTIGFMSFFECADLKSVTISSSVNKIYSLAFANCFNLTEVNIPKSVIYIGNEAFRDGSQATYRCEANGKPELWSNKWVHPEGTVMWGQKIKHVGIADEAMSGVTIYAYGRTIVVENATDEILVYNAMGALICKDATNRIRTEITVNGTGVYIVKTGNTAKRVVVN